MKKFGSLLLSGIFVVIVAALWLYPKINSAKNDTYVRVIEKPSAISHWESVKKNVEAVQIDKETKKELVNPERFETKKVSVKEFEFDEDMYGRGMHYEPYVSDPTLDSAYADSTSIQAKAPISSDTTASIKE